VLYSHASELAIRAALFLALQSPGKLTPVHEIAQRTRLPRPYLAKLLRQLAAAGLVRAFRGPGGGVELGRAPEAVTLWAIVRAIEGPEESDRCVLGLHECRDEERCPLHNQWRPLRAAMHRLLQQTTLAALARRLRETGEDRSPFPAPPRRERQPSVASVAKASRSYP